MPGDREQSPGHLWEPQEPTRPPPAPFRAGAALRDPASALPQRSKRLYLSLDSGTLEMPAAFRRAKMRGSKARECNHSRDRDAILSALAGSIQTQSLGLRHRVYIWPLGSRLRSFRALLLSTRVGGKQGTGRRG